MNPFHNSASVGLHVVGARCGTCTEILAAELHLEALASCWKLQN